MYNVLNQDGDKIQVKTINPMIHRHLSGREFTQDDACVKETPKVLEITTEMTREEAIKAYKAKYNKTPSHLMKTENIIKKLW